MPNSRISALTDAPACAVVGMLQDDAAVQHVGVLAEPWSGESNEMEYADCGPPLRVGQSAEGGISLFGRSEVHVVGWLADLSEAEIYEIQTWIALVRSKIEAGSWNNEQREVYVIRPRSQQVRDRDTNVLLFPRFSCAGFVDQCYQVVELNLVSPSDDDMPEVSRAELEHVYGEREVRLGRRYGLDGEGPWRVLLPGYLIAALRLDRADLPYSPSVADRQFGDI